MISSEFSGFLCYCWAFKVKRRLYTIVVTEMYLFDLKTENLEVTMCSEFTCHGIF